MGTFPNGNLIIDFRNQENLKYQKLFLHKLPQNIENYLVENILNFSYVEKCGTLKVILRESILDNKLLKF